jgi:hypothetical protein
MTTPKLSITLKVNPVAHCQGGCGNPHNATAQGLRICGVKCPAYKVALVAHKEEQRREELANKSTGYRDPEVNPNLGPVTEEQIAGELAHQLNALRPWSYSWWGEAIPSLETAHLCSLAEAHHRGRFLSNYSKVPGASKTQKIMRELKIRHALGERLSGKYVACRITNLMKKA